MAHSWMFTVYFIMWLIWKFIISHCYILGLLSDSCRHRGPSAVRCREPVNSNQRKICCVQRPHRPTADVLISVRLACLYFFYEHLMAKTNMCRNVSALNPRSRRWCDLVQPAVLKPAILSYCSTQTSTKIYSTVHVYISCPALRDTMTF